MPDVHTGDAVQRLHDYWQNVAVDDTQRRILMCSGPSGTEELCCAGIGTWAYRVCSWFVKERPANEAGMHNPRQATIKFSGVTDNTRWSRALWWIDWKSGLVTSCKKLEFKTVSVDGLGSGMGKR